MNSAIAKKRMNHVINMDIITSSESDFLATHVALEKIYVHGDRWDGKEEAVLSEEQVYNRYIMNHENEHQFLFGHGGARNRKIASHQVVCGQVSAGRFGG